MSKGYEVRPDGTIVVETLEEALAISRRLSVQHPATAQATVSAYLTPPQQGYVPTALQALSDAGRSGMKSKVLAKKIGLPDPRGLSGVIIKIRNEISAKANGQDTINFLWNNKKAGQPTTWFADGDKLREIGML